MSIDSNLYSQGGGGYNFEDDVATIFFINMLIGAPVPALTNGIITGLRQQASSLGYQTDDLLLHCTDDIGPVRLLLQVKNNIVASNKNNTFRDVITAAWKDFTNSTLFDPAKDRIFLVSSTYTKEVKNHFKEMLIWAKVKSSSGDFYNEVARIQAKKDFYDLIKSIIATTHPTVTDDDVFRFCRCFDLLAFDLGSTNSVTKTTFLTFLKLAIAPGAPSPIFLWNNIHTMLADSRSKGGSYDLTNIPATLLSAINKDYLRPIHQKLHRISDLCWETVQAFGDRIGTVQLDRSGLLSIAQDKLANSNMLVITGDAGHGKSAIAKALLQQQRPTGYVISMKADELNAGHLRDWFLQFDVQLTVEEIFSNFPLSTEHCIYIDGFEKLLEGDGTPFKELLLSLLKAPSVKLIVTCRKSSFSSLEFKFLHQFSYEQMDIPSLSDAELQEVATKIPELAPIIANTKLKELIRIPMYLDFASRAVMLSAGVKPGIDETTFSDQLWACIVENKLNENIDGLPMRRGNSFIDIAVTRSKKRQAFVAPQNGDSIALHKLEKDQVILQSQNSGQYAPAHDILEDWALIRFVDYIFNERTGYADFFGSLGTSPAMRRAYRLWVSFALKQQQKEKISFITDNLTNTAIQGFWKDESLIAILYSTACKKYLDSIFLILQQDNWAMLFRITHVMRTACKENIGGIGGKNFIPSGYGWEPVINLLAENFTSVPKLFHPIISSTLEDWSTGLKYWGPLPAATRNAGLMALQLLNEYRASDRYPDGQQKIVERAIEQVFHFCGGITEEVKAMLSEAQIGVNRDYGSDNWRDVEYYRKVIEIALSGLRSGQLSKFLPDELIVLAKKTWYQKQRPQEKGGSKSPFSTMDFSSLNMNEHFGLSGRTEVNYSIGSAYNTPVLWLLRCHPDKGLDFVIELINYTTAQYAQFPPRGTEPLISIKIKLPDNTEIEQIGNYVLWDLYRAKRSVSPYLLQSVLMALEKYLLEFALSEDDHSEFLQRMLDKLLRSSKSVATTAVITSIVMANPVMAGDAILPIISHPAFYAWDIARFAAEIRLPLSFFENPVLTQERKEADNLKHRRRYPAGIKGLVALYCFNIQILNDKIFRVIDELKQAANPADLEWQKLLSEIDIRNWAPTGKTIRHGDQMSYEIAPTYSEKIQEFVDENSVKMDKYQRNIEVVLTIRQAYSGEKPLDFQEWSQIFEQYKLLTRYKISEHEPGLLACIGIRDFWQQLSDPQKEWSFSLTMHNIQKYIEEITKIGSFPNIDGLNGDFVAALSILPTIIGLPELLTTTEKEILDTRKLLDSLFLDALTATTDIQHPAFKAFLQSISADLWRLAPEKALLFFKGFVAFAAFREKNEPVHYGYNRLGQDKKYQEKRARYTEKIISGREQWDGQAVDFDTYSKWSISSALHMIPDKNPPAACIELIHQILAICLQQKSTNDGRQDSNRDLHEFRKILKDKVSKIIFHNPFGQGPALLYHFMQQANLTHIQDELFDNYNAFYNFFRDTIRNIIFLTDRTQYGTPEQKADGASRFTAIWPKLEEFTGGVSIPIFTDLVLLNIDWKDGFFDWYPIETMTPFFEGVIAKYGALQAAATINLLTTIGNTTLMPKGIFLLAEIRRKRMPNSIWITDTKIERLLQHTYDRHWQALRSDHTLFKAFLFLLDEITSEGSSIAYWIREFTISYKAPSEENVSLQ